MRNINKRLTRLLTHEIACLWCWRMCCVMRVFDQDLHTCVNVPLREHLNAMIDTN